MKKKLQVLNLISLKSIKLVYLHDMNFKKYKSIPFNPVMTFLRSFYLAEERTSLRISQNVKHVF